MVKSVQGDINLEYIIKIIDRDIKFYSKDIELSFAESQSLANKIWDYWGEKYFCYIGFSKTKSLHKIGISNDPIRRQKQLGIYLIDALECKNRQIAEAYEKELHSMFRKKRVKGEWFSLDKLDLKLLENYFDRNKGNFNE